jgi:hypothetical protein
MINSKLKYVIFYFLALYHTKWHLGIHVQNIGWEEIQLQEKIYHRRWIYYLSIPFNALSIQYNFFYLFKAL